MKITEYKTFLTEDKHCRLSERKSVDYPGESLNNAQSICKMLCGVFHMDALTEEHVFLLSFNTKFRSVGIFEVSHGTVDCSIVQPREVFQKALLSNAASIVIAHNHPSGDPAPSGADQKIFRRLKEVGDIIGIPLIDFLIIGEDKAFFSFHEQGFYK